MQKLKRQWSGDALEKKDYLKEKESEIDVLKEMLRSSKV